MLVASRSASAARSDTALPATTREAGAGPGNSANKIGDWPRVGVGNRGGPFVECADGASGAPTEWRRDVKYVILIANTEAACSSAAVSRAAAFRLR